MKRSILEIILVVFLAGTLVSPNYFAFAAKDDKLPHPPPPPQNCTDLLNSLSLGSLRAVVDCLRQAANQVSGELEAAKSAIRAAIDAITQESKERQTEDTILQNQISNIQLLPGPPGPQGPVGTFSDQSCLPDEFVIGFVSGTIQCLKMSSSQPTLSINDGASVTEGNSGTSNAVFTVSLSAAASLTVTVDYATSGGTATSSNYIPNSGTLIFAPGETTKTITVSVIGDLLNEPDEIFNVNLSSPTNAVISDGQGIGTIIYDD